MSDNIPLSTQRSCTEDERYVVDIFSYVQPTRHGNRGSLNQLILYITRALDNPKRLAFIQREQSKLGLMKVHSDIFYWKKTQGGKLIAKVIMEDFQAEKEVERKKIDEMTLSENIVYTLPNCDASTLKLAAKLMDGNLQTLLETGELNVKLLKLQETRAGVEHDHFVDPQGPTEQPTFT